MLVTYFYNCQTLNHKHTAGVRNGLVPQKYEANWRRFGMVVTYNIPLTVVAVLPQLDLERFESIALFSTAYILNY